MPKFEVIAIDGPAASGKTSVARRVADELGYDFVSSGSIYRAIAFAIVEGGAEDLSPEAVALAVGRNDWDLTISEEGGVLLDGRLLQEEDLTAARVNAAVSHVAAVEDVRAIVSRILYRLADARPLVVEGRDIGSVVFPEARAKLFIDARPEIRDRRRRAQGIEDAIAERDRMDTRRAIAPLRPAEDAVVIDTSDIDLDDAVSAALAAIRA